MNLHNREGEEHAKLLKSLKSETEDIKNRLVAISARCHDLENMQTLELKINRPTSDDETVQELLRDALEKNQQWLAYDQQREAYVTAVLARIYQLEQQQGGTSGAIQQLHKGADSEERSRQEAQRQYEEVLKTCEEQLKQELGSIAQAQTQLSHVKREVQGKQEELCQVQIAVRGKQKELDQVQMHIQQRQEDLDHLLHRIKENSEKLSTIQDLVGSKWKEAEELQNDLQAKQQELDQVQNLLRDKQGQMGHMQQQLKDQRRELKKGVQLQEVLHQQQEEQTKISVLEKQVSHYAEDLEEQKCEKKNLQRHLHKVLKDLSKAQDYISKLENELDKAQSKSGALEEMTSPGQARQRIQKLMGSPRVSNPLDESFLECPNCRIQYPASRHRELVMHIDKCCG